jgi:hypothetical protein
VQELRPEHLALVPDAIDDLVAASLAVAYLKAQVSLALAGFTPAITAAPAGNEPAGKFDADTLNSNGFELPSCTKNS